MQRLHKHTYDYKDMQRLHSIICKAYIWKDAKITQSACKRIHMHMERLHKQTYGKITQSYI